MINSLLEKMFGTRKKDPEYRDVTKRRVSSPKDSMFYSGALGGRSSSDKDHGSSSSCSGGDGGSCDGGAL